MGSETKWRRECPRFGGESGEYKGWKGQVEDWMVVCESEIKYPGIEIRLSLKGKALEVVEGMDREALKGKDGPKLILNKLDEVYLKDSLMENYGKMKTYFKIVRDNEEKMRDFILRYEKAELECTKAIGRKMFEGEAKGFHVLEQANLTENQKQMVLAACGDGKLEYDKVSQILKRIFEGLGSKENSVFGSKENSEWWGLEGQKGFGTEREYYRFGRGRWARGRGGRNPLNKDGKVTLCAICKSEWHWARECPQNVNNKKKFDSRNSTGSTETRGTGNKEERVYVGEETKGNKCKEEKVYIGEVMGVDDEPWSEVDAILDTGCKSTVCGEL